MSTVRKSWGEEVVKVSFNYDHQDKNSYRRDTPVSG
jgi:hypothetical protein